MAKPNLSIDELNEARKRSGNLGGRPRKPTVAEARAVKLEELVPKALRVLDENLDAENEHVRQRAADSVLDRAWGKAVQAIRTETDVSSTSPFDKLSEEEREAVIRAARSRIHVLEAESENGSSAS